MSILKLSTTLRKNMFWATSLRLGTQALTVFANLILARILGVDGLGEYAFISAVVLIANAFTTFGTDMVLIKKISAEKDYSDLSSSLIIQLFFSLLIILVVMGMPSLFLDLLSLRIYIFSLIPLAFFTTSTIALRGSHQIFQSSILNFCFGLFQFASACILLVIRGDIIYLSWFLLISHILLAMVGILLCMLQIENFEDFLLPSWKKVTPLLRVSIPLAVIGSLRLIYQRFALTFLPIFADLSVTGLFSASARILDAAKLGFISALTPIYPEMTRDQKFIKNQTALSTLLFFAFSISIVIYLFATPIVTILFGSNFISSASALQIVVWALIPYVIVSYYSLGFVALNFERPVLFSLIISLLVLIFLFYFWGTVYGLTGVAFAVLSAEVIQASLLFIQWRKYAIPKLS